MKGKSMIVCSGLIQKKPDWSTEDFRRHWREHHGALAARLPGLLRYEQNHVIDSEQRGFSYLRGPEHLDGFSMRWFESEEAMQAALATEAGQALIADENHFIGDLRIVTIDQVEVIAPAPAPDRPEQPLLKRMSLLRRGADISPEQFRHEWRVEHAHLVKRVAGVRGYRQNLITGRQVPKGVPVGHEGLPIDGIVELWFDDTASLNAAFASPQGTTLMTHAREFIAEITTFLVERHVIV
jgi:uncharacterized protein (TIGR02118 family)